MVRVSDASFDLTTPARAATLGAATIVRLVRALRTLTRTSPTMTVWQINLVGGARTGDCQAPRQLLKVACLTWPSQYYAMLSDEIELNAHLQVVVSSK